MKDRIQRTGNKKLSKKFKTTCILVSSLTFALSLFLGLITVTIYNENKSISSRIENVGQQINYFENQNDKVSEKYKKV